MTVEKLYKLNDMSSKITRLENYKVMLEHSYHPHIKIYTPITSQIEIDVEEVLTTDEVNDILSLVYKSVTQKLENLEKEFNES